MIAYRKFQKIIGVILLLGTLFSASIVVIGVTLFLMQHGSEDMHSSQFDYIPHEISLSEVWQFAFSFAPLGIIQLGLLLLVATQIVRVALLCWFYTAIRDYRFTIISFFILFLLLYSCFWRH